jgi:hypothetical protein
MIYFCSRKQGITVTKKPSIETSNSPPGQEARPYLVLKHAVEGLLMFIVMLMGFAAMWTAAAEIKIWLATGSYHNIATGILWEGMFDLHPDFAIPVLGKLMLFYWACPALLGFFVPALLAGRVLFSLERVFALLPSRFRYR